MEELLIALLPAILETVTPEVKKAIKIGIAEMEKQAAKTQNRSDDALVLMLKFLLLQN